MKTITINGVEFRVAREATDTTVVPISGFGPMPIGVSSGTFSVRQIVDLIAPGVEMSITGNPDAVKRMLGTLSDPLSHIQRALSALGYVVGDHEKDVAQFSQWVDYLAEFPQSEEALELWTRSALALLPSNKSIEGTSLDARDIVVQRMRLFPPTPKTGLDDGPLLSDTLAELHEWRAAALEHGCESPKQLSEVAIYDPNLPNEVLAWEEAAKQRGWNSPLDLRGRTAADDAELQEWRSAAKSCGLNSPKELADSMQETFGQFVDRKIVREWQEVTGCETPEMARMKIGSCDESIAEARSAERSVWQAATNSYSPNEAKFSAEQRERAWCDATNRTCPGDAEQRIEDLQLQTKMQAETVRQWQAATERQTPELAKTHISQLENRNAGLLRDIVAWQKATGASDPDGAIARARADLDAWQEATGAANSHAAYKRIQELESKLLSYAGEIDALRKASSTMVRDPAEEMRACDAEHEKRIAAERELAKVRAELQSKCREAQTERERADKSEAREHALWASIHRIREAAGLSFDEETLLLIEQWCSGKRKEIDKMREALGVVGADDSDLPEHVADLKKAERDNDATIDELRKTLHAKEGERTIDAAKRMISEAQSAIAGTAQDVRSYWLGVVSAWEQCTGCATPSEAREKLSRAIVPLPKPEKVEVGQKWAFVMTAAEAQNGRSQSPSTVGRFIDASGSPYSAFAQDMSTALFLGT